MAMPDSPHHARSIALQLPPGEQWTLHHVLLDRIERDATAADAPSAGPPPVEVVRAFETLDAGETRFTLAQLEAIQALLGAYHHAPSWELDRPRLEQLLRRVADALEQHGGTPVH